MHWLSATTRTSGAFTGKTKHGILSPAKNLFAFNLVSMIEWTKLLPERNRLASVTDVLDRYRSVACGKPVRKAPSSSTKWMSHLPRPFEPRRDLFLNAALERITSKLGTGPTPSLSFLLQIRHLGLRGYS